MTDRFWDGLASAFLLVVFAAVLTAILTLLVWAFVYGNFWMLVGTLVLAVVLSWAVFFTWPELDK